ncbi:hypothetical protein H4R33_005485 [Dimargaris cristalligena]|nr:hypothetical protein H4R33_005485 [Dimargaris cristalligena]
MSTTRITPLPWWQVTVLLLIQLSEPINCTVLFPFVYFMVRDFHITDDPKAIGFYVGIVASAFSVAQLATGMLWGFLSDRIGRRPILLLGVMGTIVSSLMFGLSQSLAWAVVARVLWGALNGNSCTAKTIMAEITDETNQAQGFSLLPLCWNLGSIIGPMIGGLLANPVANYPSLFGDSVLLAQYPYLLPCLFCAALSACSWTMCFFFLEETLHRTLPAAPSFTSSRTASVENLQSPSLTDNSNERSSLLPSGIPGASSQSTGSIYYSTISGPMPQKLVLATDTQPPTEGATRNTERTAAISPALSKDIAEPPTKQLGAWAALAIAFNRDSLLCIAGYFGLSLVAIMFDELYPVWSATHPDLGGIGLNSQTIGFTLSAAGIAVLYVQITVYPKIQRYLGSLLCFRYGMLLYTVLALAFPFIAALESGRRTHPSLPLSPTFSNHETFLMPPADTPPTSESIRGITWVILILALILRVISNTLSFTSSNILVNNSVPKREALGTVNGVGQTAGSLGRSIGPLLAGAVWSWSLASGHGFPFDFHFVFFVISLFAFVTFLVTYTWHPRINHRIYAEAPPKPSLAKPCSV